MPNVVDTVRNIWAIEDLRKRVLFTFALLAVYRLGSHIPTPGVDPVALSEFFKEMAGKVHEDALIYGHTHKPYMKEYDGRFFINAGSVGKPKDGDPRACVALVDISAENVGVAFLRDLV